MFLLLLFIFSYTRILQGISVFVMKDNVNIDLRVIYRIHEICKSHVNLICSNATCGKNNKFTQHLIWVN